MDILPLARYRFTFRITQALRLQDYAGSALRGAFGHALKHLSCVTKAPDCTGCPVAAQCPYTQVFAPHTLARPSAGLHLQQQVPVPYVIEAPNRPARVYLPEETLSFNMVLMGQALGQLPIIILAWRRAFLLGIAKGDGTAELISVEHLLPNSSAVIYSEQAPEITSHNPSWAMPSGGEAQNIHLQFITPLRLVEKSKVIGPRQFAPAQFLIHLIRRISLQSQIQGLQLYSKEHARHLQHLARQVQGEFRFNWKEWQRYSSRQKQKMNLGGLVGRLYLHQVPPDLQPLITLGEWLHVGKEAAFGLGGYKQVQEPWLHQPHVA